METIKLYPYYRTKNKLFYRYKDKKFFIEKTGVGCYKPNGNIPFNVSIIISFKNI